MNVSARRLQHTASAIGVGSTRRGPGAAADDPVWLEEQVAKFREQSYVIIPGALSPEEVRAINEAIDRDRVEHPYDWDQTRGGSPGGLPSAVGGAPHRFQSVAILERTDAFDNTICHPSVWPLIQRLMGGDACFDEASIMVREGCPEEASAASMTGGGNVHEQHWHRDGGAANHATDHPLLLRNLSLVWLLDDCDEHNHAFSMVPESVERKRALMRDIDSIASVGYRFGDDGKWMEPPPQVDPTTGMRRDPIWDDLLSGKAVDCTGPAGSAVLMNTGCAHAGSARQTSRARRTIHHYYGHEANPPLSFHWPVPPRFWGQNGQVFSRQGPVKKIRLVGDSIRMGYEPTVISSLRARQGASTASLPSALAPRWAEIIPMGDTQGGTSSNILEHLDDFILNHAPLDVLHLNCGLHDMAREGSPSNPRPRVSLEDYENNLRSIVRQVQAMQPHIKVILCTTTCVDLEIQEAVEYGIYRSNADVAAYNEVMRRVAASDGVGLHDLHGVSVAVASEGGLGEDGVHWTDDGARALGEAVANFLWSQNCSWSRASASA